MSNNSRQNSWINKHINPFPRIDKPISASLDKSTSLIEEAYTYSRNIPRKQGMLELSRPLVEQFDYGYSYANFEPAHKAPKEKGKWIGVV